jgi:hypothetical protein
MRTYPSRSPRGCRFNVSRRDANVTRRINVRPYRGGLKVWFTLLADDGQSAITWAMSASERGLQDWYVVSHYTQPLVEWWAKTGPCDALDIPECYGDTGALIGERVLERFVKDGEDGVWDELSSIADDWAPVAPDLNFEATP